jgi:NAD(P)H-nitrite reductase large subunit
METKYKYLIIGGGIAGTTAAETIRNTDKESNIAIVSDEPRLYSRIMLSKPNFFLGKVPFDSIWLKKPEWYEENKIDFLENAVAEKLDTQNKTITLRDGRVLQYEKLLLATGGESRKWPITGSDKKGICYLRDLNEGQELMEQMKTTKKAVVIGSGFVSFEMCDILRLAGIEVTLVMREPYFWFPLLDNESAKIIETALEKGGVKIFREMEVSEILGQEKIEGVILKNNEKIDCELAVVGIGLVNNLDWIKNAGIEINRGILANEYLETNVPDIYTAGDVAEFNDLVLGERVQLGNWMNAQMQGRTVANNMLASSAEMKKPFKMVSFYTAQGFGLNIAMSGDVRVENIPSTQLRARKIIKRGSPEINSFARIVVDQNDEIIGATFLNRTPDMSVINKLIESNFKVSDFESQLSDLNFDLKSLL